MQRCPVKIFEKQIFEKQFDISTLYNFREEDEEIESMRNCRFLVSP